MSSRLALLCSCSLAISTIAACTSGRSNPPPGDLDASFQFDAAGRDSGGPRPDAGPPRDAGDVSVDVVVWAHSGRTLYAFDPRALSVTAVGDFTLSDGSAAPNMTDLAVTRDGDVYTCSAVGLYRVDTTNARTTHIADFDVMVPGQFNGMTFLPEGVLEPSSETLVAATASGEYFRIDPVTAAVTTLGRYSDGYGSSGDIVSVAGAGTFATVTRGDLGSDLLVEVDPATGNVNPVGSGTGYTRIFGLGYFRNRLYGFTTVGELVQIDIATGVGTLVSDTTGASQFYGAGVTTNAPIAPF